ncbi:MAG: Rrf2 family transcriptional regulator [Acidobacteria bacterium]|nr:Rrf2 family transcriptional regulator [Acidobacteriota bacterium]
MKLSSHEEYGLRCLLRIGFAGQEKSVTIPEISEAEGMSHAYAAKLLRILRRGGFIRSARGKDGGYTLARPAGEILIRDVMNELGGRFFEPEFCNHHSGQMPVCANTVDCSVRSLWRALQVVVDSVLSKTSLQDLMRNEHEMNAWVESLPKPEGLRLIH